MVTVLTVALVILAIALIGLVLMQRSEGGALGIGGGMSGFMTGRSAGNLLTKMTAVLGALFMIVSLALAFLSKRETTTPGSVVDPPATEQTAPLTPGAPALPSPGAPTGTDLPAPTPGAPTTSGPSETESGTSGGAEPAGPPTGN